MPTLQPLTLLTVSSALAVGLLQALLGNLKQQLARRTDLPDLQFRRLLAAVNFALLPMLIVAGLLIDFWGVRQTLLAGSVLLALSFLAFSAGLTYWRTLVATMTAALGGSALFVSTLVLMPGALFGKDQVAASLQLGLVIVALGALLTPPLFDLLLAGLKFRRCMALLALVLLAPAFLTALPEREAFPDANGAGHISAVLEDASVWMAGLVVCFYAPLEACISVWVTSHLEQNTQTNRQALWLASFWVGMLVSRLLLALLQHNYLGDAYDALFLVSLAGLTAVLLGNLSSVSRLKNGVPGLFALGIFLGPVYPVLLGMVLQTPSVMSAPGTTLALLHMMGSLTSLLMLPLLGYTTRAKTLAGGLRLPLLQAVALTLMALLFTLQLARG